MENSLVSPVSTDKYLALLLGDSSMEKIAQIIKDFGILDTTNLSLLIVGFSLYVILEVVRKHR